jgi:hypothetical protein
MTEIQNPVAGKLAVDAINRCNGSIIFSFFGAVWLLLSASSFSLLNLGVIAIILALALGMLLSALAIKKRGSAIAVNANSETNRQKDSRAFGFLNLFTWGGAFVVANVLINMRHKELVLPALVAIVGLHFFFMPGSYRQPGNNVTGACMIAWAIVTPMIFRGEMLSGAVTLGAGLIVWISALFKLGAANNSMRQLGV